MDTKRRSLTLFELLIYFLFNQKKILFILLNPLFELLRLKSTHLEENKFWFFTINFFANFKFQFQLLSAVWALFFLRNVT